MYGSVAEGGGIEVASGLPLEAKLCSMLTVILYIYGLADSDPIYIWLTVILYIYGLADSNPRWSLG